MMKKHYDAIVIGAGPAGLTSATEMAEKGLSVAVLDEQATPGGQIYRNITQVSAKQREILGEDYTDGDAVINAFENADIDYLPKARVWQAEATGEVFLSHEGASGKLTADYIVIATGAMERPAPFPGWTLPGVMTCGGMSNLFKDSSLSPKEPVVLAGSGPLLWLVAEHLFALDAPVAAILDTTPISQVFPAMKHLPEALKRFSYMMKGVKMIADVQLTAMKRKVPVHRGVSNLQAIGDKKLQSVKAKCGSKEKTFQATTLLVSEGVIPNSSLLRQVGVKHTWDDVQRYWYPDVTVEGRSNLPSVFVAGDGAFVHGAKSAEIKGKLTGLTIALEMRRMSKEEYRQKSAKLRADLEFELAPRPFIDAMYAPRPNLYKIPDSTTVCRCEGLTAGQIREKIAEGYSDHNDIKAIIRCGMGPCQGRMCTPAVNELILEGADLEPEQARPHRLRPPIKPVSLEELANAKIGGTDES